MTAAKKQMTTSQRGLDLIETAEGLSLTAYRDGAGIWTIGYGHTQSVRPGMVITAAQAQAFLRMDIRNAEAAVNTLVCVNLTQNQFDALVDFTYNLGRGTLAESTLLRKLNQGDTEGAAAEFDRWIHAGGKVEQGLVTRRASDRALFERPQDAPNPTINWMQQLIKTQRAGGAHA